MKIKDSIFYDSNIFSQNLQRTIINTQNAKYTELDISNNVNIFFDRESTYSNAKVNGKPYYDID